MLCRSCKNLYFIGEKILFITGLDVRRVEEGKSWALALYEALFKK